MRAAMGLLVLAGCGRVAFDPLADAVFFSDTVTGGGDAAVFPSCLDDAFVTDTGWVDVQGKWTLTAGAGPDGSQALVPGNLDNIATHASLTPMQELGVAVDFTINNRDAVFSLHLIDPATTVNTANGYQLDLTPLGSNSLVEGIFRLDNGTATSLDTRTAALQGYAWHRVALTRAADASLVVVLDGNRVFSVAATEYAPPFELLVRIRGPGAIDNVHVDCTR